MSIGAGVIAPVVIEHHGLDGEVCWLLSFNGSNPDSQDCIELTKDQCFWLAEKIKSIAPNHA